ncbi:prolipoprotein diacylglyceryl transferase [Brevundimonas basaltis]|uniref:Phosphatidylglycerol--prolipoprotein diacylglyceryl transferase n=1 Tax=Brevundimonas basaltis TaxID=472166 RepID=A0A7W8HZS8_9CAUL|nr:phosphatidylglycerol:prolipoprotein diacylglycerol transferase [Brevundimonas basaltis]
MQFPDIDPVWFQIGPFFGLGPLEIRWYALAYVAGIVLGWWYANRLARNNAIWQPRKAPVTTLQIDDLVLWITLGIILGGRFGYALFYKPSLYAQLVGGPDNMALFRLWDGGMSFHGGLIGVTLAIVWFAWKHKVRLLSLGDLVAPVVPLGLFFGRIANFINGELWGRPTDAPWGMVFCNDTILDLYGQCPAGYVPRHPSQLYEAALEGIVLAVILWLAVFKGRLLAKPGYVTGIFLFGYGLARASLETVRQPDFGMENLPLGLTMGMMLSIPMMIVGAWLIWRAWSRPPVTAED